MTFPQLQLLIFVVVAVSVTLATARAGIGFPKEFRLRMKGLDLLLAGKPAEAEKCFKEALDLGSEVSSSDKVRLLVCLGDALIDQGRFEEAEEYVASALQMGDPTGSGQGSMSDVLLLQKKEPEKAMEFANQAFELVTQRASPYGETWKAVQNDLNGATMWARKAQALTLLGQRTQAREALDRGIRIVEGSKEALARTMPETNLRVVLVRGDRRKRTKGLQISAAHWQMAQALLDLGDTTRAAEHLRIVRDADLWGKYRNLAHQELIRLGAWAG